MMRFFPSNYRELVHSDQFLKAVHNFCLVLIFDGTIDAIFDDNLTNILKEISLSKPLVSYRLFQKKLLVESHSSVRFTYTPICDKNKIIIRKKHDYLFYSSSSLMYKNVHRYLFYFNQFHDIIELLIKCKVFPECYKLFQYQNVDGFDGYFPIAGNLIPYMIPQDFVFLSKEIKQKIDEKGIRLHLNEQIFTTKGMSFVKS